jgi:hypothetical protein
VQLHRNIRRIGWAAFALFALKGVAWLALAALSARGIAGL